MSRPIRCSCQTKDKCCRLGHIFRYFMQHPDVYTQQQWNSLDAYKYFRSEHVCCCFLMGESKLVWQIAQNCEAVSRPIQCSYQTKDLDCKCCRLGQIFRYFIQHPDVYMHTCHFGIYMDDRNKRQNYKLLHWTSNMGSVAPFSYPLPYLPPVSSA